jgi:hypothetical protein
MALFIKMRLIKYFLLLLLFEQLHAQNQNLIWVFGDSAGIDFNNMNMPVPIFTGMDGRGSCVSFCDSAGQLKSYGFTIANSGNLTTNIFDGNNVEMDNGDSIEGVAWYNELVQINQPDSFNNLLLFSISLTNLFPTGFFYSQIDLNLNNGLGAVTQKNIPLLNNRIADCLQAIRHGNGRDWWVVTKMSGPGNTYINRFYVYLVTPNGIAPPIIQDFGNAVDGDLQKIYFNNAGTKLMNINFIGLMTEYDFDRCTGLFSNPKFIFPEQNTNTDRWFWEGAYSPNDSLFYATTTWKTYPKDTSRLLQLNLYATNIPSSCDTLYQHRNPIIFGALRLAPDKKIYMASGDNYSFPAYPYPDSLHNIYIENLGVINYPDSLGSACNFVPFSFHLGGKRVYIGLPNNPNYSLGRLYGSPCDTLQWVGIDTPNPLQGGLNAGVTVRPNPFGGVVNIEINNFVDSDMHLKIVDAMGREVLLQKIVAQKTELDLSKVNAGLYSVIVYDANSIFTCKIIRE